MNVRKLLFMFFIMTSLIWGQDIETPYKKLKIKPTLNEIQLDSVGINQSFFKILDASNQLIDTSFYEINFQKATLKFKPTYQTKDSVIVRYLKFPDFMTKTYTLYDEKRVVSNEAGRQLYQIKPVIKGRDKIFQGLNTNGSITRGVTIGNNQNAVVNSNLDLQISGKISENVGIRASIQDSNIPLQEGGYSQRLDEFDQIFIELFSKNWSLRAGDLFLENRSSKFLNFNKKVQGLYANIHLETSTSKTTIEAAGALVRGQYVRSVFTGSEGNQGPYKLKGNNSELFVLVISGSERVYVNGIQLERGENNQYTINYNAGEITFTSLFPITSEMRIQVEYQISDQNYTRFITYGGAKHERENWYIGSYLYSENDVKNQPLQQSLSIEQVEILKNAGDNKNLMNAPSAFVDNFSENKILYRKIVQNGVEIFEFSNNPEEVLYNVRFNLVGENTGNYILINNQTVGRIYEYVAPQNGIPQGNFEPIIKLIAPVKLQIATIEGGYNPDEKTKINFELGTSINDLNLYSSLDDKDNQGLAGLLNIKKTIVTRENWRLESTLNYQWIEENFRTIERLFTIEFNRDWGLESVQSGDQQILTTGLNWNNKKGDYATYQFEKLDFTKTFSGIRHKINGLVRYKNFTFLNTGSLMNATSNKRNSRFFRDHAQLQYQHKKNWLKSQFQTEDVIEKQLPERLLTSGSQNFKEWGISVGRGDSTKVFIETGYLQRTTDSLVGFKTQRVTNSDTYFVKSRLIQKENRNLSVYINYRNLKFTEVERKPIQSINSRIAYQDAFFKQIIQFTTIYENTSGNIAQQEFTYLEVEPGQGVYTWNDYNGNGIQELEEFEIAPFPDLAIYVRIFLPNQVFLPTHLNRFSQGLVFNFQPWQNEKGFKKFISHFYNQSSFLKERKTTRSNNGFDLNPFSDDKQNLLGLNTTWLNSLFFNRGKQLHTTTYSFSLNESRNLLASGLQETKIRNHQMNYLHLLRKFWLFSMQTNWNESELISENFSEKNYKLQEYGFKPSVSFLFNQNTSLELLFQYKNKQNQIGLLEQLNQTRIGTALTLNGFKNWTINGTFSFYENKFKGNNNTAVAFQMLEGLQAGQNQTWQLLVQKRITDFLDININYQGRKSETSNAIHTGSIQLRAYF